MPVCFAKQDSVPDWVSTAAAQKLPDYPADTNAVVLLDDTTYTVAPNGQATEHYRHVVKILRPQGRDGAIVAVPFDQDTKILSLQYALKDNEIVQYGYPGQGNFFEDDKVRVARAPGRDPGGIVAYEYEQRIRPMLTEKTWFFQGDLPSLSQTFMAVTDRDRNVFLQSYFNLSQLDDDLAIVNVGGQEKFFDPGSRFSAYGHLAWKHTRAAGLRQTDGGTAFANAPGEPYTASRVQRGADLTLDSQGVATGTVRMVYTGAPALRWRQRSLTGDATCLDHDLRTSVEELLPAGMDVKVTSIEKLTDYEEPLHVNLTVKGAIGSSTGKRLLIPGNLFEVNSKPSFPHEKREIPVYFDYPFDHQDAVRVSFPSSLTVESLPANDQVQFQKFAVYTMKTTSAPASVTVYRNYSLGEILYFAKEYPELRNFYSKMETKDQESIVLTSVPSDKSKASSAAD